MAKKLQLSYREIEQRLADSFSTNGVNSAEVGYKLLYSFGKSERDIERYKEGKGVLKTFDGLSTPLAKANATLSVTKRVKVYLKHLTDYLSKAYSVIGLHRRCSLQTYWND